MGPFIIHSQECRSKMVQRKVCHCFSVKADNIWTNLCLCQIYAIQQDESFIFLFFWTFGNPEL